MFIIKKKIRDP